MAIYINYTNLSIDYYTDDAQKLNQIKSLLTVFEEKKLLEEKTTPLQEEDEVIESDDGSENSENVENLKETEKNDNFKNIGLVIDSSESNKISINLSNQTFNLEEFTSLFLNKEIEYPEEIVGILKSEKQVLILPDDIVSFDYVVTPILNFWKTKQALNLKLSIDYKNFDDYGRDYKLMNKVKPNSMYAIQLSRQEIAKRFSNYFSNLGIKFRAINFYSGALASFYSTHVRGAKNASIVVKISENKTTILAIVHGFVVCFETLHAGEKDIYKNSTYKFDEYSRRSISHKFVCYSVSQIAESNSENGITREQIEKAYSKTKTNPLAGNFQYKSINLTDLVQKKVDDIKMFLANSEFKTNIENVFVDVKNDETFAKLKLDNAIKIYYPESDIFKNQKQSKLFNFNNIATKFTKKGILGRNTWLKGKKKA